MKPFLFSVLALAAASLVSAEPALTIYNQNFAVVREQVPLSLQAGMNSVSCSGVTEKAEPDSVVLRDPTGKNSFRVLEQNYRADTISQGLLLSLNEGKTLDFIVRDQNAHEYTVKGRVIRSGYVPAVNGQAPRQDEPIIDVGGQIRFSLPGEPLFPALADDAVLKPMLVWQIDSPQPAKFDAELSYVTGGMSWQASYNIIAPEQGDVVDLVGWVTIDNQSGKEFENARVKLMAGQVNKLAPERAYRGDTDKMLTYASAQPAVTEKAFDEFHLYSLPAPVTLHDRETKQVEFLRATNVKAATFYVYDGARVGAMYRGWNANALRDNRELGTQSSSRVSIYREFENTEANGLGVPLPQGRTRFYRRDDADGRLEFTGENLIEHTPRNEKVRLYTGDAFDLVGERRQTGYVLDNHNDSLDESFEIRLRNRKKTDVEIRVRESLFRGANWEIVEKSHPFTKTDARTAEFRLAVPADSEVVVTYRVHYAWK